jgi:hypothetical protein
MGTCGLEQQQKALYDIIYIEKDLLASRLSPADFCAMCAPEKIFCIHSNMIVLHMYLYDWKKCLHPDSDLLTPVL